ncbi:MAG: ABC transporter ATP-binding protein [Elusimicrobiota bacterium]
MADTTDDRGAAQASPENDPGTAQAGVVIEARGVSKSYLQGTQSLEVLQGVDLTVHAGEFVAILGPSGSGKSTLLNLLGLMDRPSAGEILLAGQATFRLDERRRSEQRNRRLGFIFQFDSLLPEFTVLENVTMPARIRPEHRGGGLAPVESRARELLGALGIAELSGRFPSQISGGERQRTAIARALVNRPAVLLADEPTGNLDRRNAELVFNRLKELAGDLGVGVVLVTHNEHAAEFATRPIHLVDGRIAEAQ